MVPEVMRTVCGYARAGDPALLHDFRRRRVSGEVYPAIVASVGDAVGGILYRGVTPVQLAALDAFEGAMYRRRMVNVAVRTRVTHAAAYVLAPGHRHVLSEDHWSLEGFVANGLAAFLEGYPGFTALSDTRGRHDGG